MFSTKLLEMLNGSHNFGFISIANERCRNAPNKRDRVSLIYVD